MSKLTDTAREVAKSLKGYYDPKNAGKQPSPNHVLVQRGRFYYWEEKK